VALPEPASSLLPVPATAAGVEGLAAIMANPARALIGLDFDGTLAPMTAEPSATLAHPGASPAIRGLAVLIGTVAVVTGRPSEVAATMLGFTAVAPPSNVFIVGHYGLETWTPSAGVVRLAGVDLGPIDVMRSVLPAVLRDVGAPAGTAIEDKGASLAVHVRRTDDPRAAMELLRAPLAHLAATHGLRLEPGRLVLELRPRGTGIGGTDKGTALTSLVHARSAQSVCYVGDDLGDLAAFGALIDLRAAGVAALGIFSGAIDLPDAADVAAVADRADLALAGPGAVVGFLEALQRVVRA
jgi:trehalose 6-phosphate phosphatase